MFNVTMQILVILQLLTKIILPLTLATILGDMISMKDQIYPLHTPCTHWLISEKFSIGGFNIQLAILL